MQFKNKKNGKVTESIESFTRTEDGRIMLVCVINLMREIFFYNSLAEFNEEWEDFKDYIEVPDYYLDCDGAVLEDDGLKESTVLKMQDIGNRFESKEKAEEAVEKLMAWKRLKDGGFRFTGYLNGDGVEANRIYAEFPQEDCSKDLGLLFGGEG